MKFLIHKLRAPWARENIDLPFEVEDQHEMLPQLTDVANGYNLHNENLKKQIEGAHLQTIFNDKKFINKENLQARYQS